MQSHLIFLNYLRLSGWLKQSKCCVGAIIVMNQTTYYPTLLKNNDTTHMEGGEMKRYLGQLKHNVFKSNIRTCIER